MGGHLSNTLGKAGLATISSVDASRNVTFSLQKQKEANTGATSPVNQFESRAMLNQSSVISKDDSRSKLSIIEHEHDSEYTRNLRLQTEESYQSRPKQPIEEADPVKVFDAVKDYMYTNVSPKFSTTRAHHRTPYPQLNTMIKPENFAKFVKLEAFDREKHLGEDISHKLSPFKNRIPIKD